MADYYPVLTRAISGLDPNTAETRRAVYERARQAIVKQLRSYDPPLSESEITKERLGLEEAVRRIEAEHRAAQQAVSAPPITASTVSAPPVSERPLPPAPPPARPSAPAAPQAPPPLAPLRQPAGSVAGEGLVKVHAAAAAAASLGAATASARQSALTTRAAFEPAPRAAPHRAEPSFERPRIPGPLPEARSPTLDNPFAEREAPGADEEEHADFDDTPRAPRIGGLIAVIVLLGIGIGAYLARDHISSFLNAQGTQTAAPAETGEKVDDRVGAGDAAPGGTSPATTDAAPAPPPAEQMAAPAAEPVPPSVPADTGALVSQRATLYDEAPDAQSGASAANGSVNWRVEPMASNPSEVQLVADISIPERRMQAALTMTRNLDETLPASHLIEIVFTLPDDFANGGVGNVPGILFKQTEADGGSALKGMSAKVTKNIFLIGLDKSPADHEQNMQAIRTRDWIDLPILYENGRRAVLTIEKGPPGERAFAAAFNAWDGAPAPATTPVNP